ncbi:MAG: TIGR03435 family protein [Myxococcota bacterium]|jgi:uncharacterized protein (TIGR03435 family)|nr:TIGR03435 family protein [Myxococcota bacterium]
MDSTKRTRRWNGGLAVAVTIAMLGCGAADEAPDVQPATSRRVSVDHIPNNPPGGRWIAPANQAAEFVRRFEKTGETIMVGVGLARLVALAYDVHPHDVVVPQADREATYDAIVKPAPGEADTSYAMLRTLLRDHLGLIATPQVAETMCMVLKPVASGVLIEPSQSQAGELDLQKGRLAARGATMAQLIELLRRDARRPIVDETGLPEHYDFVLEWDPGKGAYAFLQALGDIGLQLEAGVRDAERWIVVRTEGGWPARGRAAPGAEK